MKIYNFFTIISHKVCFTLNSISILGALIFVCQVNIASPQIINRISMPPYGEDWKRSLLVSDYELYRRLGELLYIVPSSDKALQLASEQKYSWSFNLVYCHNIRFWYVYSLMAKLIMNLLHNDMYFMERQSQENTIYIIKSNLSIISATCLFQPQLRRNGKSPVLGLHHRIEFHRGFRSQQVVRREG